MFVFFGVEWKLKAARDMLVKLSTERVAFSAVKQIEEATLKLNIQIVRELGVRNFPFTVIHAWTEESSNARQDSNSRLLEQPIAEARRSFLYPRIYLSKEQAIRLSRYVFLFGIFPAIFVIFIFSADNINRCQFQQHFMNSFLYVFCTAFIYSTFLSKGNW